MARTSAKVTLHNLHNSDGSALYTSPNATLTLQSSVHYPLEVPYRSEELPTNTYIEVSLRLHNGIAVVKERYIEEMVRKTLRSVVLGEETPRCMLQTTIQVMEVEADEDLSGGVKAGGQGEGYLDLLVGAINASIWGCLDGGVQMKGLVGAVLVGTTTTSELKISPSVRERKQCTSLHAFGFNSKRQCVLMESHGSFEVEDWEAAEKIARLQVCGKEPGTGATDGDVEMNDSHHGFPCLFDLMRKSIEDRVMQDERWKS